MVKQHSKGQTVDQADWLLGADLLGPAVEGVALRSLKAPGTAYDDDVLGKDGQPAHMDGYVRTKEDNGGVHINASIPAHAFYLMATAAGGSSWEGAGRVWWEALFDPALPEKATFAAFAGLTVAAAKRLAAGGPDLVGEVMAGWTAVGVTPA
jgi:Zn-dependent metalloprotease